MIGRWLQERNSAEMQSGIPRLGRSAWVSGRRAVGSTSGGAVSFIGTWVLLPSVLGIICRNLLGDGDWDAVFEARQLQRFGIAQLFKCLARAAGNNVSARC